MDQRIVFAAAVVVIVSVMTALLGYGMVQLFDDIVGGDPLAHDDPYSFDGTIRGNPVSGTGESKYIKESDDVRVYSFHFSDGDKLDMSCTFVCDGSGRPTDDFTYIGNGPGGTEAWFYTDKDVLCTYYVGDNCLVRTLTMLSDTIDIRANLTT